MFSSWPQFYNIIKAKQNELTMQTFFKTKSCLKFILMWRRIIWTEFSSIFLTHKKGFFLKVPCLHLGIIQGWLKQAVSRSTYCIPVVRIFCEVWRNFQEQLIYKHQQHNLYQQTPTWHFPPINLNIATRIYKHWHDITSHMQDIFFDCFAVWTHYILKHVHLLGRKAHINVTMYTNMRRKSLKSTTHWYFRWFYSTFQRPELRFLKSENKRLTTGWLINVYKCIQGFSKINQVCTPTRTNWIPSAKSLTSWISTCRKFLFSPTTRSIFVPQRYILQSYKTVIK